MTCPNEPHQAAIAFRDELLRERWPDDRGVLDLMGIPDVTESQQYVAHARTERILLGVWSAAQRKFFYPDFQFDPFGKLRPEVAELLMILPCEDDRGGWRRAFWLYSPHSLLDGNLPAEVFLTDQARVLSVAREEFCTGQDEKW